MRDFAGQMPGMGRKRAETMRDKARSEALKRKEEYLGARVPRELREKVIAKAESLGIPVSILIRNILEAAFSDHESGSAGKPRADKPATAIGLGERFPGVIGWEEILLNRDMDCSVCSRSISAGRVATLGLASAGEDHVILCERCKERA